MNPSWVWYRLGLFTFSTMTTEITLILLNGMFLLWSAFLYFELFNILNNFSYIFNSIQHAPSIGIMLVLKLYIYAYCWLLPVVCAAVNPAWDNWASSQGMWHSRTLYEKGEHFNYMQFHKNCFSCAFSAYLWEPLLLSGNYRNQHCSNLQTYHLLPHHFPYVNLWFPWSRHHWSDNHNSGLAILLVSCWEDPLPSIFGLSCGLVILLVPNWMVLISHSSRCLGVRGISHPLYPPYQIKVTQWNKWCGKI